MLIRTYTGLTHSRNTPKLYCYSTTLLYLLHTAPVVEVHISVDGMVKFGESLKLDCTISGVENLLPSGIIAFQWKGPRMEMLISKIQESTSSQVEITASFSSAGTYNCSSTVNHSLYLNDVISNYSTQDIVIDSKHFMQWYFVAGN